MPSHPLCPAPPSPSVLQPGVASIYSAIAQSTPGAPDFFLEGCGPALHGKQYSEARRSHTEAVVRGPWAKVAGVLAM